MARLAFRLGVLSGQGKAGHRIVIEIDRLPGRNLVASRAVLAVTALMDVIGGMAAKAGRWGLRHFRRLLVARRARGCTVSPLQWEAGHPAMIEADLAPAARGVAASAVGTIGTLVTIVAGVASEAAARWVPFGITGAMTSCTGCRCVTADQWKARGCMIERGRAPARSGMARSAIRAAAAAMGIILGMAGIAGGGQVLPALAGMAAHTGLGCMRTRQGKAG